SPLRLPVPPSRLEGAAVAMLGCISNHICCCSRSQTIRGAVSGRNGWVAQLLEMLNGRGISGGIALTAKKAAEKVGNRALCRRLKPARETKQSA
ncbi:MAG: hypothetical protein WCC25_16565, partial [Candidatus Korobacteraceae bacterium]